MRSEFSVLGEGRPVKYKKKKPGFIALSAALEQLVQVNKHRIGICINLFKLKKLHCSYVLQTYTESND